MIKMDYRRKCQQFFYDGQIRLRELLIMIRCLWNWHWKWNAMTLRRLHVNFLQQCVVLSQISFANIRLWLKLLCCLYWNLEFHYMYKYMYVTKMQLFALFLQTCTWNVGGGCRSRSSPRFILQHIRIFKRFLRKTHQSTAYASRLW